ncbi:MAG: glycerophosphodiester phosphodiesterase [Clostridiaceae bacterium]|nr:glycerophosphodiester phosphodiesterase [Clostridiaceae bacterium]
MRRNPKKVRGDIIVIKEVLKKKFIISGHRGYSHKYPENTLLSFKEAIELGVDMLELDLHLSSDKVIMIMHDNSLERTTNGKGLLREKTCAELKKLDAGGWKAKHFEGLKIPTFEEFLTMVKPYENLLLSVEIKVEPDDVVCADEAIAMTNAFGVTHRCVFTSFDALVTDHIYDKYGLPTLGYDEKYMINVKPDSISKLWSIGVPLHDMTLEYTNKWREKNIWPCPFCPDTAEQVIHCIENGGAMVTCNDPIPAINIAKERGLR